MLWNKRRFAEFGGNHGSRLSDDTLRQNSGDFPDGQLACFAKKEWGAAIASGVGVGEAVPDQHRANSLNTGWVKVPVKFPALAVVDLVSNRSGEQNSIARRPWNCSAIYQRDLEQPIKR
jgi:hypothetical protein